jgi:hypothetical protein
MGRRWTSTVAAAVIGLMTMAGPAVAAQSTPELDALIAHYAAVHDIPESLIRRVIKRESNYNPRARNRSYYGLMQISHATARSMGYRGQPKGLLDAETNLQYGGKYLAGAYLVAGGNEKRAVRFYTSGYYYAAKRKGLLEETGLKAGFTFSKRKAGEPLILVPPEDSAVVITRKTGPRTAQKWVIVPRDKPWVNADALTLQAAGDEAATKPRKRRKPGVPRILVAPGESAPPR